MFSIEKAKLVMGISAFCPIAFWMGCTHITGTPFDVVLGATGGIGFTYTHLWLVIQAVKK